MTALSTRYPAVHQRMRRQRGPATDHACATCGRPAAAWAYDKSDPDELTATVQGRRVTYSADITRYVPLCRTCHHALDHPKGTHCKRGHERTPANTYTRPNGHTFCRPCRIEMQRQWRKKNPD